MSEQQDMQKKYSKNFKNNMSDKLRSYSVDRLVFYRNEAWSAIFDALHARVAWMTAQRIHDIIAEKGKSYENPYIENYNLFITFLYMFVAAWKMTVIRREDLNGEYFEEWADEPVLYEDLKLSDDSTKETGTMGERLLYLFYNDWIAIQWILTAINSTSKSDFDAWQRAIAERWLSADTLFYKFSSGSNWRITSDLPNTPETLHFG